MRRPTDACSRPRPRGSAGVRRATSERAAETAVGWAAQEGWDPGRDDAQRFLATDRDAFIGLETDAGDVAGPACARRPARRPRCTSTSRA